MPVNKLKLLTFIAFFFLSSCTRKEDARTHKQPNLVLIVIDDLNDWVLEKFPELTAPNLRKLAQESYNFKNAYTNAPLCVPSRTSFMTGKLPTNTGIYLYPEYKFSSTAILKKNLKTIPEHFKASGYKTLATGKLFHEIKSQDSFYDIHHRETGRDDFPGLLRSKVIFRAHDNSFKLSDEKKADWVIEQLKAEHQKPFFLNLGFEYPHLPWIVPQKYFDLYPVESISLEHIDPKDLEDLPQETLVFNKKEIDRYYKYEDQMKEVIQAYLASLTYMDEQLGRVMNTLENSSYKDNTIVVLFSDHGYHLGEKTMLCKKTLWERSNRIPFMIKTLDPEVKEINENISLIDLFPTLIELCELPKIDDLDGESLVGLMNQNNPEWKNYAISTMGKGRHSIKKDSWRYIRYSDGSEELYDHKKDLEEYNNLALNPEFYEIKTQLAKLLPSFEVGHINFNIEEMIWIAKEKNNGFWIDQHEVTNKEFIEFGPLTKDKGSMLFDHHSGEWTFDKFSSWKTPSGLGSNLINLMNHPVVHIDYDTAQAYCNKLNKRLPTEKEWELAANKLTIQQNEIWLANIFQGDFPKKNSLEDGFQDTAPIKSYPPNRNELYDMAGNVWEWVEAQENQYLIKGGSFLCGVHCQGFNPQNQLEVKKNYSASHLGFRCAQN